ncbi:MAG: double-strand break repair protein AddB [Pseudomonadota bacterium]
MAPSLFTIAPSTPFLRQLAKSWLSGDLSQDGADPRSDPLTQLDTIFYLPTRRAARAFAETLTAEMGGTALLPRIRTLADMDEDEQFTDLSDEPQRDPITVPQGATPRAMSTLRRRLLLTRMIDKAGAALAGAMRNASVADYPVFPQSSVESTHLARALAALIDQVATEESDWQKLFDLVPEDHAAYWQVTSTLLTVVTQNWPALLAEEGAVDAATHRRLILDARTHHLIGHPPDAPVIAAGSTGSIPATARFLAAIARAPGGAVVLPGLDLSLSDELFRQLADDGPACASHPQHGLARLLKTMRARADEVVQLGPAPMARRATVSHALLPASATHTWSDDRPSAEPAAAAINGVQFIEAPTEGVESLAIAMQMKASVTQGQRVALVTPDRDLALRVQYDLQRFGMTADDSAGTPLRETMPSRLMLAAAEALSSGFAAVPLLALLKHPLCSLGQERSQTRADARLLERLALRGPALPPGLDAIRQVIAQRAAERSEAQDDGKHHIPSLRKRTDPQDDRRALNLLKRLEEAFAPLATSVEAGSPINIAVFGRALFACCESLCEGPDPEAPNPLYYGPAGEALADHHLALAETEDIALALDPYEASAVFEALLDERTVRPRGIGSALAVIWGPLEARLQPVDHIILGGLNENNWPSLPRANPFVSRAMMAGMELALPERRIGLSAHDFEQALGTPEVTLTRALKVDGAPTVASRWLQRLLAYLPEAANETLRAEAAPLLEMASRWDDADGFQPEERPAPRPNKPPTRLSITDVETLIRDPYAIFAKRVLRLESAPGLAEPPGGRERGEIVHALLQRLAHDLDRLPVSAWPQAYERHARSLLEQVQAFPAIAAFWQRRLALMERAYLDHEETEQPDIARRFAEVSGRMELAFVGHDCVLSGRADRIDLHHDGSAVLTDFKTGDAPSEKQVDAGLAPQLPLSAAMLQAGGFEQLASPPVAVGRYLLLGKAKEALKPRAFDADRLRPAYALEQLEALWSSFLLGAPFRPLVRPMTTRFEGDYHHLSRAKAWQVSVDVEMDGAGRR